MTVVDTRELTDEQRRQAERVMKILAVAQRGGTPEEAATAAAKAQEMLALYNLDLATVEREGQGDGKRETAAVDGGQYTYQRDLWRAVAELNFCMYFHMERRAVRSKRRRLEDGTLIEAPRYYMQKQHQLVGRRINTLATRNMSQYLEQAIDRLCRERYPEQSQFFSRSAVSFRKGMATNLVDRLWERRQGMIRDEEKKRAEAAERARAAGIAESTSLTLGTLAEQEKKANFDEKYGAGAWDRVAKIRAENAAYWAEQERKQAEWEAAHPEEAARERKRAQAAERAREKARLRRREQGIGPRYAYGKSSNQDDQAFYAGLRKGAEIGLDPQAEHGTPRSRRIG